MSDAKDTPRGFASPPCLAHEIDPAYADTVSADPQQVLEVARWRKAERARLLGERTALTLAARKGAAAAILPHLDALLAQRFSRLDGLTVSAWWPIRAELDLRDWLAGLAARGTRAALPVGVTTRHAPLEFREWTPQTPMTRGFWNIPVPAAGPALIPDIVLAPLVGWDGAGYFDRTLAGLAPRPLAIGIGFEAARLATIFPQPHDIAMQAIITETGVAALDPAR